MMVMMSGSGVRLVKVAFRAATRLILHLYRSVVNLILLFEKMMDPIQEGIMIVRRHHLDVQGH